jgi:hypothetical protein
MKHAFPFAAAVVGSAVLASLSACRGGLISSTQLAPAAGFDCAAVAKFSFSDNAKVTKAEKIEAGTVKPAHSFTGAPIGDFLPAHCLVQGAINSRTGKAFSTDPATRAVSVVDAPYAINFELRLPKDWNGRFFFQGGGGLDGVLWQAVGIYDNAQNTAANALSRGFAVVSTDAGHQGKNGFDGSFGADQQAREDYAYNALDQVTVRAKDIIKRYYGKGPDKSYFVGCSNGGRQGMLASQRFPSYFDGIVAGNPGFNLTNAAVNQVTDIQAVAATLLRTAMGPLGPDLTKAFSPADSALIGASILKKCDVKGRDTVQDGIVGDVEACDFKVQTDIPTCSGANDGTCLTAAQKTAVQKMMEGGKTSQGTSLYSDYFADAGIGHPVWHLWKTDGIPVPLSPTLTVTAGLNVLMVPEVVGKVMSTPADTAFNAFTYNPDTDPAKTVEFGKMLNATSTDLSAYKSRGGKLIVYHGTSDAVLSAKDTLGYYKKLAEASGGDASDFARLFLVPGMAHCTGGPATDSFDALTAIQDWVEKGTAPASMTAKAGATTPWPNRTRPVCAYPKVAVYKGSGSLEEAGSFVCQ